MQDVLIDTGVAEEPAVAPSIREETEYDVLPNYHWCHGVPASIVAQ